MNKKIIGVTVGTTMNPQKVASLNEDYIKSEVDKHLREQLVQLISERFSEFFVISDTEPDNGPCIWFDTSIPVDPNEDSIVTLVLSEDVDESEVLAFIDDIGYGVANAEAPVLADDGSTYTITIS